MEGRTEIEFFDSECSVLSNLPLPKQNEVYYWESKIYDKPETTLISIGVATKPYPLFRLPGMCLRYDNLNQHDTDYMQDGISILLHTHPLDIEDIINLLADQYMARNLSKEMLLVLVTDLGLGLCSLRETGRSWRTWRMA